MSAIHAFIRNHAQHNPLSGPPVAEGKVSPFSHSGTASRHSTARVEDPLSRAWDFLASEAKSTSSAVTDGLSHLYHSAVSEVKHVKDIRDSAFATVAHDVKSVYDTGVGALESVYDYRQQVFHDAGQDISGAFHSGQAVYNAVQGFSPVGVVAGGLGGSFLTLAALAALFVFAKA